MVGPGVSDRTKKVLGIFGWGRKKKYRQQKSVLTMASYDCKRHHGWHTQTALTNKTRFANVLVVSLM